MTQNKPSFSSYLALCKLRVVSLISFSAIIGLTLAPADKTSWVKAVISIIGITMAASAGAVFNHVADSRIDSIMQRTKKRPLPQKHIRPIHACLFGGLLTCISMALMSIFVNNLTAILTFATMIGYAIIYSVLLKPRTPQNIVIGGLSGALPPLLGWTSITNSLTPEPWLLVLIIFVWTPAHFWALAIDRVDEYKKASVPVLPVTHGIAYTKTNILMYALLTACATYLPFSIGLCHNVYAIGVSILNSYWMYEAYILYYSKHQKQARHFFKVSLIYLTVLFIIMLIDHYLSY